jgi:ParB family chromosome partitioning protein
MTASTPAKAAAAPAGEIPLNQITPSRANPRGNVRDQSKFAELVASVRTTGVLSAILVRPHPAGTAKGEPPLYEIVFGEGRYLAAKAAGLATIPARVEDMDDKAALEAAIIENVIREDMHPLAEAEAFAGLITNHGHLPSHVAEKIGKSEKYVQRRLKLASLIPAAKEHFYAGRLTLEHYLQLARVDAASQAKALPQAWRQDWKAKVSKDGERPPDLDEPFSAREFTHIIKNEFFLSLKSVPWDKTDAALDKTAGACNVCPKRTGASALLFDDEGAEDNCLDHACFENKQKLHLVRIEMAAKKAGAPLVRVTTGYLSTSELKELNCLPSYNAYQKVSKNDTCGYTQRAVVVHGDNVGQQLDVCTNKKCKQHMAKQQPSHSSGQKLTAEDKQRRTEQERKREIEEGIESALINAILAKTPKKLGDAELAMIAAELSNAGGLTDVATLLGWKLPVKASGGWRAAKNSFLAQFQAAAEATRVKVLVALCLFNLRDNAGDDDELASAAKAYGIDAKTVEKQVRATVDAKYSKTEKPAAVKKALGKGGKN